LNHFRPKEVLNRAREAEKAGDVRSAANGYAILSVYLRRKQRFADAKSMIEQAIKLTPKSGRLYLEKSLCEWSLDHAEEAKAAVQKCARLGIENRKLKTYLGYLEHDLLNLPQLREHFFDQWLAIDRTAITPFAGLAQALIAQEKWAQAKIVLLDGLVLSGSNVEVRELLNEVIIKLNNSTESEYWERFKNGEIEVNDLMVLLGSKPRDRNLDFQPIDESREEEQRDELKDLSELVEELEKELELDSEDKFENIEPLMVEFRRKSNQVIGSDAQARLDLAHAFFEMGRYREAREELSQIDASNVLFGQAQYQLGNILKSEGSEVAALGAYQTVLRVSAEDSPLWKEAAYQLAKLYFRMGDKQRATDMIFLLEKKDKDYRTLKTLKQQLGLNKKEK